MKGRLMPDEKSALVASDQAASRLAPTGFDPSRDLAEAFYDNNPDTFFTGELDAAGEEITRPVAWDELSDERKAEVTRRAELESKSIDQISGVISAMAPLIDLYANNVARAEERFQRERTFLADLMAEYLRLTHFIARKAAQALEEHPAIAMEARQGPDPQGLDGEAATARASQEASPNPSHLQNSSSGEG
jgi:hypothetical protein